MERCFSPTEPIWLSFVIGYKIILQGIGCFLAFNIRKVKIKGLNDSKEVSAILYTTFVLIAAIIIVTFIYGDYVNIDGGIYGLGIFAATTVVLTFIFVPKVHNTHQVDMKQLTIFLVSFSTVYVYRCIGFIAIRKGRRYLKAPRLLTLVQVVRTAATPVGRTLQPATRMQRLCPSSRRESRS